MSLHGMATELRGSRRRVEACGTNVSAVSTPKGRTEIEDARAGCHAILPGGAHGEAPGNRRSMQSMRPREQTGQASNDRPVSFS